MKYFLSHIFPQTTKVSVLIQTSESKLSNIFIYVFQSTFSFMSKAVAFALFIWRAVYLFRYHLGSLEQLGVQHIHRETRVFHTYCDRMWFTRNTEARSDKSNSLDFTRCVQICVSGPRARVPADRNNIPRETISGVLTNLSKL